MDTLKLRLNAGQASSSSTLGPALGQKGINMGEFVSTYNDLTKHYDSSNILNVKVKAKDRKFSIRLGYIQTTALIKKVSGFKKASGQKDNSFRISVNHLYMVTLLKKQDPRLAHLSLVNIFKMVMSTAKSMHMTISK